MMSLVQNKRLLLVAVVGLVAVAVTAVVPVGKKRELRSVAVEVGSPCGPSLISPTGDFARLALPDADCQWRPAPLVGYAKDARRQCCCVFDAPSRADAKKQDEGLGASEDTTPLSPPPPPRRMFRCLPHSLVIGAQKSGTTALFGFMMNHPNITTPRKKELHFFDRYYPRTRTAPASKLPGLPTLPHLPPKKKITSKKKKDVNIRNYLVNLASGRFAPRFSVAAEATPAYVLDPRTPDLVHAVMPDVKLILILRDPVTRLVSEYKMKQRRIAAQLNPKASEDDIRAALPKCDSKENIYGRLGCLMHEWEDIPGFSKTIKSRRVNTLRLRECLMRLFATDDGNGGDDESEPPVTDVMQCFRPSQIRYERVQPIGEAVLVESKTVAKCLYSSTATPGTVKLADGSSVPAPLVQWGEPGCWPLGSTSDISKDFVMRGLYYPQIVRWLQVFPHDQLLLLDQRDLQSDPESTMERVWKFLGLPYYNVTATAEHLEESLTTAFPSFTGTGWSINSGTALDALPPAVKDKLTLLYEPHNRQVEELLQQSLNWTSPSS